MKQILQILFLCLSLPCFAGGYIAADKHKEYLNISDDETPFVLCCFVIWILYFVLKQFNNKFVNKYESIILPVIFILLPLLIGVLYAVSNI